MQGIEAPALRPDCESWTDPHHRSSLLTEASIPRPSKRLSVPASRTYRRKPRLYWGLSSLGDVQYWTAAQPPIPLVSNGPPLRGRIGMPGRFDVRVRLAGWLV